MLHTDLCTRYAHKSPKDGFNNQFTSIFDYITADLEMSRWGRGVSYHDFELTIGTEYASYIIANGYEPEILSWFPINIEEEVLRYYISQKEYNIPDALQRGVINMIFRKSFKVSIKKNQPPVPAISIEESSYKNNYIECSKQLSDARKTLDEILKSKRWKIGDLIGRPYRTVKNFIINNRPQRGRY